MPARSGEDAATSETGGEAGSEASSEASSETSGETSGETSSEASSETSGDGRSADRDSEDRQPADQLDEAWRLGMRRAGLHLLRAGYEVVAGFEALLEELTRARNADDDEEPFDYGTTRIDIE